MNTTRTSSTADAAAAWDQRYAQEGYLFGTAPNDWLMRHARVWAPAARVLSVADGDGRNSAWLAANGWVVDAFDLSPVGVAKARRLATAAGATVDFQIADCDSYAWPAATYDGIAAIFVQFADPEMRARMFAAIVRSLKVGGTLVLQGYTPRQLVHGTGGPKVESHLYTESMLRLAFADMDILELRAYEAELDEGSAHRGPSSLIGLVARKR